MAEKRRRKKKESTEPEKLTKEETAVARHLRFNLATKTTSIDGHKVEYFTGSKAVDFLQDSKWATGKGNTETLFTDRTSVANYLDGLLWKGLFYRALKVVKKSKKEGKEKDPKEKEKEKEEAGTSKKEKRAKKEKKKADAEHPEKGEEKEKEETKGDVAEKKVAGKEGTPTTKKKEGKRKIKLEPTPDQKFVDGSDAYVWVYDPVRPMNYVYGFGLVIGAIAVCLFPLWPPWMRVGTYYLSLCGAGFVGAILVLAIVRLVLFVLAWGATFGTIHFWLFPNLLADVGIKESFMPLYTCDVVKKGTADLSDAIKDEKGDTQEDETSPDYEQQLEDAPQDSKSVRAVDKNTPENIGIGSEMGTGDQEVSEEQNVESADATEDDEVGDEGMVDDDDEDDDDEEENGDGFEMIDDEEISEVCEGSMGSQDEEEE